MPRNTNLQTIKNEALAKLNSFHKLIDGRTDAAYRRKIFATERKDIAVKLFNEISAISIAKTENPNKKVTATMITKANKRAPPVLENTIIKRARTEKNEVFNRIYIKVKTTYVDKGSTAGWVTMETFNNGKQTGNYVDQGIVGKGVAKTDLFKRESIINKNTVKIAKAGDALLNVVPASVIDIQHRFAETKTFGPFNITKHGIKVYKTQNKIDKIIYTGTPHKSFYSDAVYYLYDKIENIKEQRYEYTTIQPNENSKGKFVDINTFARLFLEEIYAYEDSSGEGYAIPKVVDIIREDPSIKQIGKTQTQNIPMKNAGILKNSWLNYADHIAEYAYDETPDICVYHQLSKFLLDPPSGLPTKFIDKQRVSPEAIFNFLRTNHPDLKMNEGVTTMMVEAIARATKRSLYAYDFNERCFWKSLTETRNSNYCPIVFYIGNGHMYLIDSKDATKSIVERNKAENSSFVSLAKQNESDKKEPPIVHQSKIFDGITLDGRECSLLPKGIYLLNRHSICNDVISFIKHYKDVPKVKCRNGAVVAMCFKNLANQTVSIECDANYSKGGIPYDQLLCVAAKNGIEYINEGIGSVILKLLSRQYKINREYLNEANRTSLLETFENKCSICNLELTYYEIDHIKPLASGGTNEIENLQPLCADCHKQKTKSEQELGEYDNHKALPEVSYFNNNVFTNVISTTGFKTWQFVETIDGPKHNDKDASFKIHKIDMNKCRRNILYYSKFEFPVFSVMDTVEEFNESDSINVGSYYVETDNTFPFRGCGWYSHPLVELGISEKLITRANIKFKLEASNKLPSHHFQDKIDMLLDAFSSKADIQKLSVNAYIGLMGKSSQEVSSTDFTLCKYEAANMLCENDTTFIQSHDIGDNKDLTLYQSRRRKNIVMESTMYPIYAQILQTEAMELYSTEKLISSFGGIPLDRNTDAIRYKLKIDKQNVKLEDYHWDDAKTVKKYKWETPRELLASVHQSMKRAKDKYIAEKFKREWKIEYDYDNEAAEKAAEIVDKKMSIHIDGRAGTGKSYLTKRIIDVLTERKMKFESFSPTNKGARIINGKTIDSMYHKIKSDKKALNIFKKLDVIIIDEVSMMKEIFYSLFVNIKKMAPNIRFIIAGDFEQLDPVKDTWTGDYKNSAALFELCDGNRLQLTKNRRSDPRLFNLCKNVELVKTKCFPVTEPTFLNVAYMHATRKRVNKECIERFLAEEADPDEKRVLLPKDPTNPKTQDVTLTIGMPVVCHTTQNDKKQKLNSNGFMNSERFEIQVIDETTITLVGDGDREIVINQKDFHKFFYIGFCITVHTSQGETFKGKYTIYDWNFEHFDNKAKYVALSRATAYENIQIA
jgi:DNA replication protein DnaC